MWFVSVSQYANVIFILLHCFSNEVFASADAAYVLAYSIILLTTDLHNNQVTTVT